MDAKTLYAKMHEDSVNMDEANDCAVRAVAAATGRSYTDAHTALKKVGRKNRRGTQQWMTFSVIKKFGFVVTKINRPKKAKTMKSLPGAMKAAGYTGTFLVFVRRHVAAFVDGTVVDWSAGRHHRIHKIYAVTPKDVPVVPVAPKPATVPGVRAGNTRAYLAGRIIAKYGLAAGVTDAMVAELDIEYGVPNAVESRARLKNAWHAFRAFTEATK